MPLQMGEKITLRPGTSFQVTRQLGEGGFSFVFLAEQPQQRSSIISDLVSHIDSNADDAASSSVSQTVADIRRNIGSADENLPLPVDIVLKVTSIHSREARDIAAKEVALLRRLNHPNIIKFLHVSYVNPTGNKVSNPLHMIALEYCNGGTALDVVHRLREAKHRFHWQQLIIVFGQIANAVTYMHAQKPPIVHRDLKLENFVVHHSPTVDGRAPVTTYKLCDFGSAVIGHVALSSNAARLSATDLIERTTSPIYRAPEMCDIYMTNKLTEKTDVWALGCCLYSLAFCKGCFEEKSNLAIISGYYKIPEDNQYGDALVDFISRMLTVNPNDRSDMPEVISCLSALYAKRPLPSRKLMQNDPHDQHKEISELDRVGVFRTDGQGVKGNDEEESPKLSTKIKILNPNSAAARRREKKLTENANIEKALSEKRSAETKFDAFFSSKDFNDNFGEKLMSENFNQMAIEKIEETETFQPLDKVNTNSPSTANQEAFNAFNAVAIENSCGENNKPEQDISFAFSTEFDNPTVSKSQEDDDTKHIANHVRALLHSWTIESGCRENNKPEQDISFEFSTEFDNPTVSKSEEDDDTKLISKPTSDENIATGVFT